MTQPLPADPSTMTPEALAVLLGTDLEQGISTATAQRRLQRDGANTLRTAPHAGPWRRALAQLADPLVLLLLLAAAVALVAWAVQGHAGWPVDAVVIAVVVLLNIAIGWLQENQAESAVAALADMTAATSAVVREGRLLRLPSEALVQGDLLVLTEGDAVGADARLLQATALRVQEASLTGESDAVDKNPAALAQPGAVGDRSCMVFKGTAVAQGNGRAIVTATGMATEMGAIATLLDTTPDVATPLQKEVAQIGRRLGIAAVLIAIVVVATLLLMAEHRTPGDVMRALLLGVSLAVAAVPEGLPAILSLVLALGVQRMARRKAIVKRLSSVETLGSATVIACDKTGTLTRAEMTIVRVMTASGSSHITGVGYAPDGEVQHEGIPLRSGPVHAETLRLLSGGSLAGNAQLQQAASGQWQIQGDPTEAAFLVAERKLGATDGRVQRFRRLAELPFTSERKMMSTLEADNDHGGAPVLVSKGAPDVLIGHCTQALVGTSAVPLDAALRARVLADVALLSADALRTLAVAYRPLTPDEARRPSAALEQGLIFVGTVGIIDPPRPEAAVAIAQAQQAGIRMMMITGDHPGTALRIATDLKLVAAGATAVTGAQIDTMDDAALASAVATQAVFARVEPRHKLRIVAALQAGGNVVAMTGDGVNDAPALKAADIGIAMGLTGTEVTKQAARLVLADDNIATLIAAVREGRGIVDNIRKFLRYLLSSNLGEVMTVFFGVVGAGVIGLHDPAGGVVLPLLATQILWINLITDAGPALAMGVDPVTDDVMARPPRAAAERIIDAPLWRGAIATGAVMAALALLALDLFLPGGVVEGQGSLALARTAAFTVLVLAQLFNCFNARSETASAWHGLFNNRWLWATVLLSAALQGAVVHLPWLNQAFGTVPMTAGQWLTCTALASGVLLFGEARKFIHRLRQRGA